MRSVEMKQISQREALDTNKFFLFDDVGEEKYDDQGIEVVVLEDVAVLNVGFIEPDVDVFSPGR